MGRLPHRCRIVRKLRLGGIGAGVDLGLPIVPLPAAPHVPLGTLAEQVVDLPRVTALAGGLVGARWGTSGRGRTAPGPAEALKVLHAALEHVGQRRVAGTVGRRRVLPVHVRRGALEVFPHGAVAGAGRGRVVGRGRGRAGG